MNGLITVEFFLINLFFGLILFLLWTRVLLRFFHISPLQSVHQAVNKFLGSKLDPLEILLLKYNIFCKHYDWLSLAIIMSVELIKFSLFNLLLLHQMLSFAWIIVFCI